VIVMGRHSIVSSAAVRRSRRLALVVGGAGALVLAGAQVRWVLRTPAHEILRSGRFDFVLLLTGFVLMVVILNRIDAAIKSRYGDRPLPAIPAYVPGPPSLTARRRVVRRWSGFAYLMMAIIACLPVSILTGWNTEPAGGKVGATTGSVLAIAACWLVGPAARFVVTREYLHIDTGFRRAGVPRALLAGFIRGPQEVLVELTDGDSRKFRVDTPLLDLRGRHFRSNVRCQFRTVEGIVRALDEVPPLDTDCPVVVTRVRWGPVALALGAVLATAAVTTLLA
jgi:hypothetical protein